jgi:hypothetical protein
MEDEIITIDHDWDLAAPYDQFLAIVSVFGSRIAEVILGSEDHPDSTTWEEMQDYMDDLKAAPAQRERLLTKLQEILSFNPV